ncbi:MAG TPA: hypothetical protein VJT33_12035 [bacterium]|nr:hypothetical protein [bacterium]
MSGVSDRIREDLARVGVAVNDEDLAMIVKIVEANRAGLARVPADGLDEPAVSRGFLPPAVPGGSDGA